MVGADDHVITPDQTRLVGQRLAAAGVPHEIVVYPDTPHGFLADDRPTFRPTPATTTWHHLSATLLR